MAEGAELTGASLPIPATVHVPIKPPWEIDVTSHLQMIRGDVASPEQAVTAQSVPYAMGMSRSARLTEYTPNGASAWWRLKVTFPAQATSDWPLALEVDEHRVIEGVWLNGQKLGVWNTTEGDRWFGGEASLLLPLNAKNTSGNLVFHSVLLPHLYEDGFGDARIRPAALDEIIQTHDNGDDTFTLRNQSACEMKFTVHTRCEDFFGSPLSSDDSDQNLAPNCAAIIAAKLPADGDWYKVRVWLTAGDVVSLDHWRLNDFNRENRARSEVERLPDGWSWARSSAPILSGGAPRGNWQQTLLPHCINSPAPSSHAIWYRRTMHVPTDWVGKRIQIYLGCVLCQATVYVDGQMVGTKNSWELPYAFNLPDSVSDGADHQILIGVTDWTVGLKPGLTPEGRGQPRSLEAPIQTNDVGLQCVPELMAVPKVRTDWVAITPVLSSAGDRLKDELELENDTSAHIAVSVTTTVFNRGEIVLSLPTQHSSLAPGVTRLTDDQVWSSPMLWTPDSPHLYELRIVLKGADGQVLDTRRERFGFRTFGYQDGHFLLNGERFNMMGGSHFAPQTIIWPVIPHAYRLVRHFFHSDPVGSGQITVNMADEMGFLIKEEASDLGALHQDKYAWNSDLIFDRCYSNVHSVWRHEVNQPSVVFWDIGNELWFDGPGEPEKMGALYDRIRTMDPTRLVTNGGGDPLVASSEILDLHGYGEWENRSDYFFYHPENRPSYLRNAGYFQHRDTTDGRSNWSLQVDKPSTSVKWMISGSASDPLGKLHYAGGKPILFSEGHYYEDSIPTPLNGQFGYVPIPGMPDVWSTAYGEHWLNILSIRKISVQNVRDAGFPASMIHVSRGVGRWVSPLTAYLADRRTRFESHSVLDSRVGLHQDLDGTQVIHFTVTLWDAGKILATHNDSWAIPCGQVKYVPLNMQLPSVSTDTTLRLSIMAIADGSGGYFRDNQPITVFAPKALTVPPGIKLELFDPVGNFANYLKRSGIVFTRLAVLDAWKGSANHPLIVASEALNSVSPRALQDLDRKISTGGRAIVLDHRVLPSFLKTRLIQMMKAGDTAATIDRDSPVTKGLLNDDFRFWQTKEHDELSYWNAITTPAVGNSHAYLDSGGASPLIDVAEGLGSVLFCQLNLQDALGIDPAARRVVANLIDSLASPLAFGSKSTLLVTSQPTFESSLLGRMGLVAKVTNSPSPSEIKSSSLIVASGTDAAIRAPLSAQSDSLRAMLQNGGTLFVQGIDVGGAQWLGQLIGTTFTIDTYPKSGALLTRYDPVTSGLDNAALFWGTSTSNVRLPGGEKPSLDQAGQVRLSGTGLDPLLEPNYLSQVCIGKGRVVISELRSLDYPVPMALHTLSQLLTNIGAKLDPERANTVQVDKSFWKYTPVDLSSFVNMPFKDDVTGRRGWHGGGQQNDMRNLPLGVQTFRGVRYLITDPEKANGNGCIALKCTYGPPTLPREVKGIPINRKADRIYFLHASAWGLPQFTYRVYYTEDRKSWIFGKPDPYVDVVVRPGENIQDWFSAGKVDQGSLFTAGCSVAWVGENPYSHGLGEKIGLYQMIWDNPHPEKNIESIDILSPGTTGSGEIFVSGITTATRAIITQSAPVSIVTTGIASSEVFDHFQNSAYGLLLLKCGVIRVIHGPSGTVLFQNVGGWSLQGSTKNPVTQRNIFTSRGSQNDEHPVIVKSTDPAGDTVYTIFATQSRYLTWSQKITCRPHSVHVDYGFEVTHEFPEGKSTNIMLGLAVNKDALSGRVNGSWKSKTVYVPFLSGSASVEFDPRLIWYGSPGYTVDDGGIRYYLFNTETKTVGGKDTLWFDVDLP